VSQTEARSESELKCSLLFCFAIECLKIGGCKKKEKLDFVFGFFQGFIFFKNAALLTSPHKIALAVKNKSLRGLRMSVNVGTRKAVNYACAE